MLMKIVNRFIVTMSFMFSPLVLRLYPPAEADGIKEATVACGTFVTAAKLGHAALFKLRARGRHRFGSHFRRRGNVIWGNRDHFRLLEGGKKKRRGRHGKSVR